MGREVRMVPPDWEHPKDSNGRYIPLHGCSYKADADEWDRECAEWCRGVRPEYCDAEYPSTALAFALWHGDRPTPGEYMPDWPDEKRTHLQMYEDTSEGTPISPVMKTPEELARWLADNGASSFGDRTASYEHWLRVCKGAWAPSAVIDGSGIRSGVEFVGSLNDEGSDV